MDFTKAKSFMDDMAQERTPGSAIEIYLNGRCIFRYASGYSSLELKKC